jgi:hypothetical protein
MAAGAAGGAVGVVAMAFVSEAIAPYVAGVVVTLAVVAIVDDAVRAAQAIAGLCSD